MCKQDKFKGKKGGDFMNLIQAILDGIAIAAIFNGTVASFVLIDPRFFFDSYPKAIQKATKFIGSSFACSYNGWSYDLCF